MDIPATAKPANERFGFLDAARAVAALAVLFQHLLEQHSSAFYRFSRDRFNFGVFGVLLFFLVSGFIIPVSLERSRSLKRFWINRVFRLYPLYLANLVLVMLCWWAGLRVLAPDFVARLPGSLFANATMIQEWLLVPHADPLFWTLGYEMLFYALCSVLFLCRAQKRTLALCWAGVGVLTVANVLLPLLRHQPAFKVRSFWVLTFFVGTLYHRYTQGQVSRTSLTALLLALAAAIGAGAHVNFVRLRPTPTPGQIAPLAYLSAWAAAYVCFHALVLAREQSFPAWLCWMGTISYSIYLLQDTVLGLPVRAGWAWLHLLTAPVGCVALAALTYRLIEQPGIALGRRLVSRQPAVPPPAVARKAA